MPRDPRPAAPAHRVARSVLVAVLVALPAFGFAACEDAPAIPHDQRTPEVASVVVRRTEDAAGHRFELESGEIVSVPDWGARSVLGGIPTAGDLLLAGGGPDQPWVAALRPSSITDDCFVVSAAGRDAGDHVLTSVGLSLPKAPNFRPGLARDGRYVIANTSFCVDRSGRITSYGTG
jgi:hypothetical protein